MSASDVQEIIDNAVQTAAHQTALVDAWADASWFPYPATYELKPVTAFKDLTLTLGDERVPDISFPDTITIPKWQRHGQTTGGDPLNDDIIAIIKDLNQFSVQYGIDAIGPKLSNLFASYLTSFYPAFVTEDTGISDLVSILTNKGYSMPVAAEDAIFQRGRSRIMADGDRAEGETLGEWASRGFILPPGALLMQQQMIRQNTQDKVAQATSDIVIKQAEMAVEFYKFAIQQTIQYREKAFDNAVQYLQVFASSILKGFGADAYAAILEARNRMYGTSLDLYKAMSANRETKARLVQGDTAVNLESWKTNQATYSELTRARSSAAIGAANAVGHVAAAAMAGINAAATISSTSST
jgi:hypothetical protein